MPRAAAKARKKRISQVSSVWLNGKVAVIVACAGSGGKGKIPSLYERSPALH
jgi:hypothetical protein